jgi:putative peptide zinc metalloprotease protein
MNLTRALDAALPEIPARMLAGRCPRVPPDAVFQEHIEDGRPVVRVLVPSQEAMYRFSPQNWALVQLFDGKRTFEEIAEAYSGQIGTSYDVDEVREFAASLEDVEFWYKTPQEKNVFLMRQTAEERRKLAKSRKSKFSDLSQITFPAVNPDGFLTWLHKYTSFIYTWWFTLLTLGLFGVMAAITVVRWSEIGRDSLHFFNFSDKTWGDVGIFYVLALVTMCWHELGHGHACKHFGGRVRSMGFLLIYLTPAFYTDTSEGAIKATTFQNFIISLAGVWSELMICAVATIIWWGTPADTTVHNLAYFLMLMTGFASVLINWNPMMKLDGYYMMCELWGLGDLKENSTAYTSAWVKRHIWKLPVDVPYVPRRRRLGYAVYALLSGLYSYTVLFVVARFVGNVFRNFNPDWSFIPELGTAALVFRSRIRTLVNFMKFVYLDKKDRVREWLGSYRVLGALAGVVLLAVVPWWRESAEGKFVLAPAKEAMIRARVAGKVMGVYANEGMAVESGAKLVELRNVPLESEVSGTNAQYDVAAMRTAAATLHYGEVGQAIQERDELRQRTRDLAVEASNLTLTSPISGTVLSPRVNDLLGTYVPAGSQLIEVADLRVMRARIYLSEHELPKARVGAQARAQVNGSLRTWTATVAEIGRVSAGMDPELVEATDYKGLATPNFYVVDLYIENGDGVLKPGMTGDARVYGKRRSAMGLAWEASRHFMARKVW